MIKFSKAMYSPMLWSKWYAQNICNALPEIVWIDKSMIIYYIIQHKREFGQYHDRFTTTHNLQQLQS